VAEHGDMVRDRIRELGDRACSDALVSFAPLKALKFLPGAFFFALVRVYASGSLRLLCVPATVCGEHFLGVGDNILGYEILLGDVRLRYLVHQVC
jgi:hypothetical protein